MGVNAVLIRLVQCFESYTAVTVTVTARGLKLHVAAYGVTTVMLKISDVSKNRHKHSLVSGRIYC